MFVGWMAAWLVKLVLFVQRRHIQSQLAYDLYYANNVGLAKFSMHSLFRERETEINKKVK